MGDKESSSANATVAMHPCDTSRKSSCALGFSEEDHVHINELGLGLPPRTKVRNCLV